MNKLSAAALALTFCVGHAALAASLTSTDADLGRIRAAALHDGLSVSVDLGDDAPFATHVVARFQNNQPLMLGRDGLWAPWNGDLHHIDEAAADTVGKKLIFRIFDSAPDEMFFPVSFTVMYRTDAAIKSGTITVDGP